MQTRSMKKAKFTLLSVAVTSLLCGAAAGSLTSCAANGDAPVADKHACKGLNACKGKGGCKTESNACKGLNACKGKGGCRTAR